MNWVLYVVLASSTASDKAINATPVPMATEQLCNEAKNKLFESDIRFADLRRGE